MTGDKWALLLSAVGALMNGCGLYLAVRAIWDETHRKNLHPRWRNTLEASQARMRALLRHKPPDQKLELGIASELDVSGQIESVVSDHMRPELRTVEDLHAHLDREIAKVREAITAQANDATQRIDGLKQGLDTGLAEVSARMDATERNAASIDTHTLDREMWGLAWVAVGSLLQAVSVFVAR